jgi:predicted nucleic acid-binding Zn ribbon protein
MGIQMAQKRFNAKNFTEIGSILDRVLHQYRPKADQELSKVWDLWDGAVGPEIAANARPAAFKGRSLLVHVSNSSWLHHLRFMEKDLIVKINCALGAERIETIHLKIGPI